MKENLETTLKAMLDGAKAGEFWIGSTSAGRSRIDRALTLEEILEAALRSLLNRQRGEGL